MGISRADIIDADVVDAPELASTGTTSYRSGDSVVSTVSSTKVVTVSGSVSLVYGDDPIEPGDSVVLTGTTAADGTYTVDTVLGDQTFDVVEAIADSTGGTAAFRHKPGASRVGFGSAGLTYVTTDNVQDAIVEIDTALGSLGGGGLTESQHRALRQLIHFIDGGPAEGFASGAYEELLPVGPFPTSSIWYTSSAKTHKIVELTASYNSNKTVATEVWEMYDTDGSTVLVTLTDTYAYSGVFVSSVTRTLS